MTEQYSAPQVSLEPDTRPTSKLAVTSLILSIPCLCLGPIALVPLVLGILGITKTGAGGGRKGQGFAVAGTALGGVGLMGTLFWMFIGVGILLPSIGKAKQVAERLLSESQVSMVLTSCTNYALDNEGWYPDPETWEQDLTDYLGAPIDSLLESPREDGDGISYIYLGGEMTDDSSQIVIYEDPKHYHIGVLVGFADGHTEMVPFDEFESMLAEQTKQPTEP